MPRMSTLQPAVIGVLDLIEVQEALADIFVELQRVRVVANADLA